MMKQALESRRNEDGQVLIYVTLALVLAMLIIPPLLGFVFTGGRSAQIREDRMLQVHAADTGIEDGYYYVVANETDLPLQLPTREVNGHDVVCSGNRLFKSAFYTAVVVAENACAIG